MAERPDTPRSPDDGVIADYRGEVGDPAELATRLSATPGVVDHGLFPASTGQRGPGRQGRERRADLTAVSAQLDELRSLYGEWGRGDFSRGVFDDQTTSRSFGWVDMDNEIRGADRIREVMGEWMSAWEQPVVVEADEFIESGDRVLVLIRWRGRGKGSGAEMEAEGAHLWTLRERAGGRL